MTVSVLKKKENCSKNNKRRPFIITATRKILIGLNILFAVCLLLAGLSIYVNPNSWVIPSYLGMVFPLLLGINFCFIVGWIIFRQAWFLFSLCVILLTFTPVCNTFPQPWKTDTGTTEKQLTMLSYNTMCNGKFVKPTAKHPNDILQYIVQTDADIVCLQEFGVHKNNTYLTISDVKQELQSYPYSYIAYKVDNQSRQIGVAIFSKYPIIHKNKIAYPSSFNSSVYCDLVIKNDTIRLINNHLESNRLTEKDINQPDKLQKNLNAKAIGIYADYMTDKLDIAYELRAQQAQAVSKTIAESPYPTIVCGDFNDVPVSYTYQTIRGNLNDAFTESASFGTGHTYIHKWLRVRIDYILHSPSLHASNFRIDKSNFSDHYPIQCQLSW